MSPGAPASKAKVGAAIAAIFLLGAVTGAAVWHVVYAHMVTDMFDAAASGSRRGVFLWSLDRKLDLSKSQRRDIEAILRDYDRELAEVSPPPDPRVLALRDRMRSDIRSKLDEKQRARFDDLMRDFDEVRKRDHRAR